MAVQLLQLVAEIHQDRDSGPLPVFDLWAWQFSVCVFMPHLPAFLPRQTRRLGDAAALRFFASLKHKADPSLRAQDDRKQRGHFTPNVASFFSNLHSSGTLARLMQISDLPARDRWSRRCRRDRRSPHSRRACLSPASGAKCARD